MSDHPLTLSTDESVDLILAKHERELQRLSLKRSVSVLFTTEQPGHFISFDRFRSEWRILEVRQIPGIDGAHFESPLSMAPITTRRAALPHLPSLLALARSGGG